MPQKINEPGLIIDNNKIIINSDLWTTQAALTEKLGLNRNIINNRVRRYVKNGLIPDIYIKALGVRLIPNVNNINELANYKK